MFFLGSPAMSKQRDESLCRDQFAEMGDVELFETVDELSAMTHSSYFRRLWELATEELEDRASKF